jgi:hypothetical protein
MVYGAFDLSDAFSASVEFALWMDTQANADFIDVSVVCTTTCNLVEVSNVVVSDPSSFEACESISIGPSVGASGTADISLKSGLEVWILPDFLIEQGATLDIRVCGLSLCEVSGEPMPRGCNSCVDRICEIDSTCCDSGFHEACLDMVATECGLTCEQ